MSPTPDSPLPSRKLRLLLIKDQPERAEICVRLLRGKGYEVVERLVSDRTGLQEAIRESEIDIVISDYTLSGWTGMQAFHLLRDQGIAAPFILFSGTIGEQRVVECLKEGVTDFLFEENIDRIGGVVEPAL